MSHDKETQFCADFDGLVHGEAEDHNHRMNAMIHGEPAAAVMPPTSLTTLPPTTPAKPKPWYKRIFPLW